jgi:hypothetical protein
MTSSSGSIDSENPETYFVYIDQLILKGAFQEQKIREVCGVRYGGQHQSESSLNTIVQKILLSLISSLHPSIPPC